MHGPVSRRLASSKVHGAFPSYRALLSAVCLAASPGLASTQAGTRAVEAELALILEEERLAGAVWATVSPDGSIVTGAAGMRDNGARLPLSDSTRVHVGSVAKPVLATGVLRLVTEGRVELDAPIARYVPALAVDNPWSGTPVTVRHLLDHTAGFEDARLWQVFGTRMGPTDPLANAFTGAAAPLRVRSEPGERMSYSNIGYTVLGLIVEAVTGSPYEAYLDAQLLAPLGMHDSTFRFTTQQGASADPALAWGHLDDGSRHAAVPVAVRPAAQFTTTAADLARFARFLMSDGRIGDAVFVRADLMRARGRPGTTEAARAGLEAGYALGLARRDRHGVVGLCHGGSIVGFNAMLCVFPDEQKAFVIGVNSDRESARYDRLHQALVTRLALRAAERPPPPTATTDLADLEGVYLPAPNRFAMFAYLDALGGSVRVRWTDGGLTLRRPFEAPRQLAPIGGDLFVASDRATASHVVLRDAAGRHRIADGFSTVERTSPVRVLLLRTSFLLGLAGLAWFLVAGIAALIRHRRAAWRRAEFLPFLGVVGLFLPVPFFLAQSFMRMGDVTAASLLLAFATAALPLTMLPTLLRVRTRADAARPPLVHAVAAIAVIQWCAVLMWWGMLPARLWS
jgi:CubicO group peptidase (beta-lactamase class C family)